MHLTKTAIVSVHLNVNSRLMFVSEGNIIHHHHVTDVALESARCVTAALLPDLAQPPCPCVTRSAIYACVLR
jgi:hypothetical protein